MPHKVDVSYKRKKISGVVESVPRGRAVIGADVSGRVGEGNSWVSIVQVWEEMQEGRW